jgi:hypothetical protein
VTSDLGRYIASRITTRLAQSRKFFVVERQRLTQVLTELKFSMSDLVDPAKAKQLGRMVGVEAIVVGTLSDLGDYVDIDARMIDIETSRTFFGTTVTLKKDQTITQMMERGREIPAAGSRPTTAAPPTISLGTAKYQDLKKLRVEVEGLQIMADGGVVVYLSYVNKAREELVIGLALDKTFLVDNAGNRYRHVGGSGLFGGWGAGWYPSNSFLTLAPGDRGSASFIFGRPDQTGKKGALFHFTSGQLFVKYVEDQHSPSRQRPVPGEGFNITIRNIEPR